MNAFHFWSQGIPDIWYGWVVEIVLLGIILYLYCSYLSRHSYKGLRSKYIILPAVAIAIGGTALYWIGYYPEVEGGYKDIFGPLSRSLISSLELFISDTHLDEIKLEMEENQFWMFCFMLCYCMAMITSMFMILELFFKRQIGKRWLRRNVENASSGRWFIFFGIDNHSLMLAKDIDRIFKEEKHNIIFIDSPGQTNEPRRFSFIDLLTGTNSVESVKRQLIAEIKGVVVLKAKADVSKVSSTKGQSAFDAIGLSRLSCWLNNPETEIFLISSRQEDNLAALYNILNSSDGGIKAKLYCHARRNDFNRRLEMCARANVNIVDSSHLAVQNLIKDHSELHPVNYVSIKRDDVTGLKMGYVTSEFNAMIVGFGEMGQEALTYLYEFGAFSDANRRRSCFNCYVIDKDMDRIEGDFRAKCPAAMHDTLIHYEKDCPESVSFWSNLEQRIADLNYVMVSLGDDELSMSVGFRILEYARKKRGSMDNFIVLVRNYSYDDWAVDMERIYNENMSENGRTVFKCFAKKHDIWRYAVISNSLLYDAAGTYHNNYIIAADDGYPGKDWNELNDERHSVLHNREVTDELRKTPKKMPLFVAMGDDRMISQDYSNVLHAPTKKALCDADVLCRDEVLSHIPIVKGFPDADDSRPHYEIDPDLPEEERMREELYGEILSHLADTEHIRWTASHEIRGCVYGAKKNEITQEHPDMVENDELTSGLTIHYDWIVVKQSLKM